jgi:nucleotide-binding universal stress UspA family protein
VAVSHGTNNSRADNLMRHIMVATDDSSGANRAVDVAAELAKAVAGDLLIATVADSQLGEEARQLARAGSNFGRARVTSPSH